MAERLLSLAAGTVLDLTPAQTVDAAAAAGFGAVGLWYDRATWTDDTTRAVADRLRATGLVALDIEPVILGRGPDAGDRIIDAAAELGVQHLLVAGGPAERPEVLERFAALCDRAAPGGITVVLEFLPIFVIGTLGAALSVVQEAARPNGGVLVDTLHLARSGAHPQDLRAVPPALLPYLQIADAPAAAPEALREEALHGRLLPGDGDLPLGEVLAAVPDVALSLELRSAALVAAHPDPFVRARVVHDATVRWLEAVSRS